MQYDLLSHDNKTKLCVMDGEGKKKNILNNKYANAQLLSF